MWGSCEGCLKEERFALLQIKQSINFPNGSSLSDWVGKDCCQWQGIHCSSSTTRVVEVDLVGQRQQNLGSWSPNLTWFAQLKELESLDLQSNQISEWVMPQAFSEMKNLQYLSLWSNRLRGEIPTAIGELQSLRTLKLYGNQIEGSIPPWLGNMTSLQVLFLGKNLLQGSLPSSIGNLSQITTLDFSFNQLGGVVSFSLFANLSKLSYLDLGHNAYLEVETESTTWVPSFQFSALTLADCRLNKQSGRKIPGFLRTQLALTALDLANTSIVGSIPSWLLYNRNISILVLSDNSLSGPFPQPNGNITSLLTHLELTNNPLLATSPTNIGVLFPQLDYLEMSGCGLHGSIPESIAEMKDLRSLQLYNNDLEGGILPSRANFTKLTTLLLHGNRLEGTLPASLANSPSLNFLDIRGNYLSGNLSNTLPFFPQMIFFLLGQNSFEGDIPHRICQMQQLKFLDLSSSHLTGTIPTCFDNIASWKKEEGFMLPAGLTIDFITKGRSYEYAQLPLIYISGIDLSSNRLTGNIPGTIGYLRALNSLNLSRNLLTGSIPLSIKNMEKTESLDLSHNMLTGKIPAEMSDLGFLVVLDVSFNDLSGEIPTKGQFFSFNESSFVGNPGLCGQPLGIKCTKPLPRGMDSGRTEEGEEKGLLDDTLLFYSFIAISYAFGLWVFVAFLFFNRKWRVFYFRAMDEFIEGSSGKIKKAYVYFKNKSQ